TINTAARLMGVSKAGEIIVDHDSFVQTEGYFEFETLEPVKVKGKAKPIAVYRVGKALQEPKKLHRLHGLRAKLIGRSVEMQVLKDAAENLEQGKGSVVSVCGTAGTGKSRLVHEFKTTLDLKKIQWFDANAYPYTQNTPYYHLIDLLTKAFDIRDGDSAEAIKLKVESNLEGLLGKGSENAPYIGSLFSIEYSETKDVSPEYWKDRLYAAIGDVLKALTATAPTVICLEDMHWADPSTMELVRKLVSNLSGPLMVVCIYRPVITIFTDFEIKTFSIDYTELRLRELSPSESQDMICSLLNADQIPKELRGFIRDSIDGNPFYVEELINALIDSEALSKRSGQWVLTKTIDESLISTNIQGVLAGRIDRLGSDTKRILQEASVIGRTFLFDILKRISLVKHDINRHLMLLERLDLIRAKSIQPTLEYIFKHSLTYEVVYNGLLKAERKEIHERIGLVIETLFHHRHQEFYEILAYHFKHGHSQVKAAEYLIKAGKKSFAMCAVEDAQKYYEEAYKILIESLKNEDDEWILLLDLLNEWAITLIWRVAHAELIDLLTRHMDLIEQIDDMEKLSLFYSSLGMALQIKGKVTDSQLYLQKALDFAEKAKSSKAIGYAAFRLSQVYASHGQLEEAIRLAERARNISTDLSAEIPLHRLTFSLVLAYLYKGDIKKLRELGNDLLNKMGNKKDFRYYATSKMTLGVSCFCAGEFHLAIQNFKMMFEVALDPLLSQIGKVFLGYAYLGENEYQKALTLSEEILNCSNRYGSEIFGSATMALQGYALTAAGNLEEGLKLLNDVEKIWNEENLKYSLAVLNCFYGQLYLNLMEGKNHKKLSFIIKNIRPIVRLVPGAAGKCEMHFKKAIEITGNIGADSLHGQAYMGLGRFYGLQKKDSLSLNCLQKAIAIFKNIEATGFLRISNNALDAMGNKNSD
ncbi:MAG: AAA family ATPase, partial [Deltaproteobacteria bacterium]|nr:AAA family ATPase [Deltaproteobacteria bacterium]